MGDENCWGQKEVSTISCQNGEVCVTRIVVQWNGLGQQLFQVSRGCGQTPPESCQSTSIGGLQMSECLENVGDTLLNHSRLVLQTSWTTRCCSCWGSLHLLQPRSPSNIPVPRQCTESEYHHNMHSSRARHTLDQQYENIGSKENFDRWY